MGIAIAAIRISAVVGYVLVRAFDLREREQAKRDCRLKIVSVDDDVDIDDLLKRSEQAEFEQWMGRR